MSEVCGTCRRHPVGFLAHHTNTGDTWQVCNYCRAQAIRLGITPIIHIALDDQERVA